MEDFFSVEGFDYLVRQLKSCPPKHIISNWLATMYQKIPGEIKVIDSINRKKSSQYEGILKIVNHLGIAGNILEVGCGDGRLADILAKRYSVKVLAIDQNKDLIEMNKKIYQVPRLYFEVEDAFQRKPKQNFGLVIGLHCCGNLTDKVIDYAENLKANVVVVPCCYGSIHKNGVFLPRSAELSRRKEEFDYVLERTRALEGYVTSSKSSTQYLTLELCRRLIDFDRIFFLGETGYNAFFTRLSERELVDEKGKTRKASPLRDAIVGRITQ